MDEICANAAKLGIKGIDLLEPKDWPTVQKHGLVPSMVMSAGTITVGWNRKENHPKLEQEMREGITQTTQSKSASK